MSAPFMQLYVADYLGDTQHLTTEQHGAYLLILMAMWRHGGKLPNDETKLARIARVSARRWHLVAADIMDFFDVEGDEITQKRLVEEYQKCASISEKRSVIGKRGGDAKALKSKESGLAKAKQLLKHSQISESYKKEETPKGVCTPTPKSELENVLDADRAMAVIDHRSRLRKPLTAHAAKLLAGKFASAPDPNAAADMMVANGWQGFELSWLENRSTPQRPSTGPPPYSGPPRTVGELAIHRLQTGNFRDEPTSHSNGCLDASEPRGPDEGSRGAKLIALATAAVSRGG
jgi:uncharacterized protein YdaU (DUF1376 family)